MRWLRHKAIPPLEVTTSERSPDEGAVRATEALRSAMLNAYDNDLVSAELGAIRREILAARVRKA